MRATRVGLHDGGEPGADNRERARDVKFLILYTDETEGDNSYKVYRVLSGCSHDSEWMRKSGYPVPADKKRNYYCYVLDEEVTFGSLNVQTILTTLRTQAEMRGEYHEGMPHFVTGRDLLPYLM